MINPDLYREYLLSLVEAFAYSYCDICGEDVDKHVFSPDVLGNPHAFCTSEAICESVNTRKDTA